MTTPNIIDTLGTSWRLDVQEFARYYYDHPTFGLLEYVGRTPWECGNVNTVHLTQWGSLPDPSVERVLPPSVCIRPSYDAECGCGTGDVNSYPVKSEKCDCADPECPIPEFIVVTCGACSARCDGDAVQGVRAGVLCPDNPSYTLDCPSMCGVDMSGTWYCCEGQWHVDWYNNGELCESGQPVSNTRCPLTLGLDQFELCAECDEGGDPEPCCDDLFGDLNGSVTAVSGCGCTDTTTFTLGNTGVGGQWGSDTFDLCGLNYTVSVICEGAGVWTLTVSEIGCTVNDTANNETTCPAVLLNFTPVVCGPCTMEVTLTA